MTLPNPASDTSPRHLRRGHLPSPPRGQFGLTLPPGPPTPVTREVAEETGMPCEVTALVGIYSDPGHVAAYDDGEVRQEFSICYATRLLGGQIQTSAESSRRPVRQPGRTARLHDPSIDTTADRPLP